MKKLILILILGMFLFSLTTVSALDFDNVKRLPSLNPDKSFDLGQGRNIEYNKLWEKYPNIEVKNAFGLGKTNFRGSLVKHTETCGIDCNSQLEVYHSGGELIQDKRFLREMEDGSWKEWEVRSYQFYYWGDIDDYETQCSEGKPIYQKENDTYYTPQICEQVKVGSHEGWIGIDVGEELSEGYYTIKLDAEKRPSWTYDWQIKTQGVWLEDWAVWGNISAGDDAEVILNSPNDNNITLTNLVTFNATANITNGATLVNMSLWTNETGSWGIRNTTELGFTDSDLSAYYKLDETSDPIVDELGVNNGTNNGASDGANGIIERYWGFNDADEDYINLTSDTALELGSADKTYNFWAIINSGDTGDMAFLGQGVGGDAPTFVIRIDSTDVIQTYFEGTGAETSVMSSTDNFNRNVDWHMVTVVYHFSQKKVSFYINGTFSNNVTWAANTGAVNPTQDFEIGRMNSGFTYFDGGIDELGIWDKALNPSEVSDLYNSGSGSRNVDTISPTSSTQTFTRTITDDIIWNVQACDSDGDCGFATSNYSLFIDTSAPTISVEAPSGDLNYGAGGDSETLNVTFTDSNLEDCWYNYNGTNITIEGCVSGTKNSTTFTLEDYGVDGHNITLYVNDSVGNVGSEFISWDYKMFGGDETYDTSTTEGSVETFDINLSVDAAYQISTANLIYDGTAYSSTFSRSGTEYFISKSLTIPAVTSEENKTFYWAIVLDDDSSLNTTEHNQTVSNINIDDCSSYSTVVLNMSLIDEETQLAINETTQSPFINVDVNIFTVGGTSPIIEYSNNFTDSNTGQVCIDNTLANSSYEMDTKIQYGGTDYRTEQYNIQNLNLNGTSIPQNITLYDILIDSSESFIINIKDGSFLPLENALVDISREYVDEGQFKSVEIPITDSNGRAVASLSPEDTTYTITISEDGETQAIFSDIIATCQNELTGECELNLNVLSSIETIEDYTQTDNLRYTMEFEYSTRTITVEFNTIDGTTAAMELDAVVFDRWSNDTACTDDLTSSSGTLTCVIPASYSNQSIIANLYKDGDLINYASFSLMPDPTEYFGTDAYVFAILIIMTIPLMFITSVVGIIIGGVMGLLFVSLLLWRTQGGALGLALSGIWLIASAGIIIWKITSGGRNTT